MQKEHEKVLGMPETSHDCLPCVQMCLEMVIALSLRNRDRLLLIWPLVHDLLSAILAPPQQGADKRAASPLVARAALGLLRVCQRLLPYKEVSHEH